jgi:arachidonate 15-lipoxygenase
LIWALIGDYVRDYLQIFCGNPAADADNTARAIRADYELQVWANELSRDSLWPGNVPGFSGRIDDFATLHRVLRLLLWIAGPRHAAVNFPQSRASPNRRPGDPRNARPGAGGRPAKGPGAID